jgi:hypothetical protein
MELKFYRRIVVLVALLVVKGLSSVAQTGFFETVSNARLDNSQLKRIDKVSVYQLKISGLRGYLLNAPMEFKSKGAQGLELELPLPDGSVERFTLFESPILSPEVALKHPEIKTYAGRGMAHREYSVRINLTSAGFNAIILGVGGDAVYFEKITNDTADSLYRSYFSRDAQSPKKDTNKTSENRCGTLDLDGRVQPLKDGKNKRASATLATGEVLRTFRLAMAADAEFTEKKGGTAVLAFAALTNYVNNMNAVYRRELSVALQLVSDESVVYTDPLGDPYTNTSQSAMLNENQANLALAIPGGYDIGHVLGYAGSSGGGVASLESVCNPLTKARGVSGVGDGSYADVFDQQLIQHEIGHQFGMTHSYNSNVPVCTTREHATSVEPGSGTTIMSYGYTCSNSTPEEGLVGNDDYEAPYTPILNFHTVNYDQANVFIGSLVCFTTTPTNNALPVVSVPQASWTIPRSTPFALTGTATDLDAGDVLSYSWEGTNISDQSDNELLTATTLSDAALPPFFRTYAPISGGTDPGTRYYPRLAAILDGSNHAIGDKLPSTNLATTHRLTVRDNDSGVSYEEVTVNIAPSGPFLITNDIAGSILGPIGGYPIGGPMTVSWSVNGTTASPVSCTLVDILLSTDGGVTFPTTLATATLNFLGTAIVVLPLVNTSQARIKIKSSNSTASGNVPNIFFDISNVNFTIGTPMPVTLVSFQATVKQKNTALLTWETSEEKSNAGFEIEMSPDARKFVNAGFVDGNGDSKIRHQYQYSVGELAAGTYYFRLKQLDYDGKFEYSQIRSLEIAGTGDLVSIFPNPTSGKLRFNPNMRQNQAFSIQITNQSGKVVLSLPASTSYANDFELDATPFATGLYHITLQGANFTERLKFMKL